MKLILIIYQSWVSFRHPDSILLGIPFISAMAVQFAHAKESAPRQNANARKRTCRVLINAILSQPCAETKLFNKWIITLTLTVFVEQFFFWQSRCFCRSFKKFKSTFLCRFSIKYRIYLQNSVRRNFKFDWKTTHISSPFIVCFCTYFRPSQMVLVRSSLQF